MKHPHTPVRIILLAAALLAAGCNLNREVRYAGTTMGTTYSIKVVVPFYQRISGLEEKIQTRLEEINASMSTYRADSEISRFNADSRIGAPLDLSPDLHHVLTVAETIHELTEGAWDGTILPLLELWGFKGGGTPVRIPDGEAIHACLQSTGFDAIEFLPGSRLVKKNHPVSLDLASIAKGFGVDAVAEVIRDAGYRNFIVDIGGEVFASGLRKDKTPWRVGVNTPLKSASPGDVYTVVSLSDRAMATSGDYRNFFELEGKRYSHVIDPRTGFPVDNGVVSVSVVADNCTLADGLATAIMVMGHRKGLDLLEREAGLEGLIIVQSADGVLQQYATETFGGRVD